MSKKMEHICVNIMKELKLNGRLKVLGELFHYRNNLEDMFRFIWNMPEFHKCVVPDMISSAKSQNEAENLLADGYTAFQNKLYKESLELYNLCIMKAPHAGIALKDNMNVSNEESTKNEYLILSSAYARRSELLFELKQYKMCIADIDRVLQYGSSELLELMQNDLQERKNDCLLALKSENENKNKNANVLPVDETKNQAQANELPARDNCKPSLQKNGITSKTNEELLFSYKSPPPPKLAEFNANIPCLSDSLEVKYNPLKGRFIHARTDIHPGEMVLAEEPYMCSPNTKEEVIRNCCCNCLKRCHAPIPCTTCQTVVFCNESCRASAMSSFHHVECQMLPTCISLGIDNNAIVACRLLTKTTFNTLKKIVPQLNMEKIEKTRESQGFDEDGRYISTDYRTIYHLEGNIMDRSMLDIFHKGVKSFLLTKMLLLSKHFFINESKEPIDPDLDDIIMIGALLLNHLMGLPQNIFAVTEFQLNLDSIGEANTQIGIGEGAYSTASLFNHSCNANTMRCNYGNVMVIYAKSFIPVGTELTTCYRNLYSTKETKERRKELQKDYKFLCNCYACLNDWPLIKNLPSSSKISIEKVNLLKDHNIPVDEKVLENQLHEVIEGYSKAFKVNDKEIEILQSAMLKTIEFMDKYVEIPCKEYAVAQIMLKHCFERKASLYCFRRKVVQSTHQEEEETNI